MLVRQESPDPLEAVVLIHGLWMTGVESGLLRFRLMNDHGYGVSVFQYETTAATLSENSEQLEAFIETIPARVIHLVGHSLGGLLAVYTVMRGVPARPGRVVCLGSPLRGSAIADGFARGEIGARLLGEARDALVDARLEEYTGSRQIGVIAGSMGIGLGQFVDDLPEPHDGTVSVEETMLPGITDHLVLPVSHTGLLISDAVATQTAYFLRHGRFRRA